MSKRRDDLVAEHLPLTPAVFDILLALADGDRHGYAIAKDVEQRSSGRVKFGPGTLYGTIKRMLASGLIEEADAHPDPDLDDERRRYYRITRLGLQVLQAESSRLATLLAAARGKKVLPKTRRA